MSECIIIAVDNSEYALNEDYLPSRWQAQHDVVTVLASAKTDGNPETTVGILSLAGKAPTIVVTPTQVMFGAGARCFGHQRERQPVPAAQEHW